MSLLSDNGIPLEEISRLVGHSSTATTEAVYRKQIRPVVQTGAVTMDRIFGPGPKDAEDQADRTAQGTPDIHDPASGAEL